MRIKSFFLGALFTLTLFGNAQDRERAERAKARAREIVSQMTLDEKVAQAHGIHDANHYRYVPGIDRLGIPALTVTNGPAGVGPGASKSQLRATALPAPIALAASWNPELALQYGALTGQEALALGNNLLEGPDVNIVRVPQGGRTFETYGEDPWLASRIAVANIQGIQSAGVLANVKHYLANNQETDRGTINEIISERALHEIYMPAFEASVREGNVASVMCAYPRVNGGYDCENIPLLRQVLKDSWGFDGFVTSDFGAVHSTVPSALAGTDLEMPDGVHYGDALEKAVKAEQLPVSVLDEMLVRRFSKMIELGLFDPKPTPQPIPFFEHGAMARLIAAQSIVLLKNDGKILPLDRGKIHKVALIGPYAMRPNTGGGGSSHVIPFYTVQPVDGLDAALLSQTEVELLDGTNVSAAVKSAASADVAIVMIGDDEGEDHDHAITLPDAVNQLVEAVISANPRTVVVLKTGSAVLMPWIDKAPAVLEAWYPGQEDGDAVADVLFGSVNPSGKLPLSFPTRVEDTLAKSLNCYPGDGTTVHYCEGLNVGYRYYQSSGVKPLFPFGYGLSYTTFHFDRIRVERSASGALIQFSVTNTGGRAGADVAQLYLTFPPIAEGPEPPHQLKGFQKVKLNSGETKEVTLSIDRRAFSWWSEKLHDWQSAKGQFSIDVGDSSADTPLHANFSVQ